MRREGGKISSRNEAKPHKKFVIEGSAQTGFFCSSSTKGWWGWFFFFFLKGKKKNPRSIPPKAKKAYSTPNKKINLAPLQAFHQAQKYPLGTAAQDSFKKTDGVGY